MCIIRIIQSFPVLPDPRNCNSRSIITTIGTCNNERAIPENIALLPSWVMIGHIVKQIIFIINNVLIQCFCAIIIAEG